MPHCLDTISPQIHRIGQGTFNQWTGPRRVIYDHELLLISSGECRTYIDGDVFTCHANDYIIKQPGVPHSSIQSSKSPVTFHWIHFDWDYHDSIKNTNNSLTCYLPGKPNLSLIRHAPEEVPKEWLHGAIHTPANSFQLFSRINERWNFGTPRERSSCRALMLELLIELLGEQTNYFPASKQTSAKHHRAEKIRSMLNRIIEQPTTEKLSLETQLSSLGYSYTHLCRIFKSTYGISPVTYLNNLRLERACMLLQDTELHITEIGERVGIANPAYFSRLFTKYIGKSPRDYRSTH